MSHDIEDLIVLARRGQLSEAELRRLGVALNTSASARALHEVGQSFDRAHTDQADDAALLARVSARVQAGFELPPGVVPRSRTKSYWLLAGSLLVAGGAFASAAGLVLGPEPTLPKSTLPESTMPKSTLPKSTMPKSTLPKSTLPESTLPKSTLPKSTLPKSTLPKSTLPKSTMPKSTMPKSIMPNSAAASPPVAAAGPREKARPQPSMRGSATVSSASQNPTAGVRGVGDPATPTHTGDDSESLRPGHERSQGSRAPRESAPTAVDPPTAQALFKAGNQARKSGAHSEALSTYGQLQRRYPASPEAELSQLLSGRMLLGMGRPGSALGHFNRYLAAGGRGGLAEEALWGKAQALSRLGRHSEARSVWRQLLDRFPKSVYAPTARQRLEQ